ncbi:MAG TPA: NHLP bacteriocin export ABC transporter permease/ATPase subunit, partial [Thermoanaerobaculia bacterium]|nr:NHLP bacteriocin export ABC transporter permease/ATPase subunit [Thermoanaerobaculia bacterium]
TRRLAEIARASGCEAELAGGLDGWVRGLMAQVDRAPKIFRPLRPGTEESLEKEGLALRTLDGVVWVRALEGPLWFLGRPELSLPPGDSLPIADETWVVSGGAARVTAEDTPALLQAPEEGGKARIWDGLEGFHGFLLSWARERMERTAAEERGRLVRKADLDRASLQKASTRLASVLAAVPVHEAAFAAGGSPLLASCRLVGAALGVEIQSPPESSAGSRQGDLLQRICAASRIRQRRVILRDDWWRRDNGPLVAFRVLDEVEKTRQAVALLPTSPHSYEMVDPVEGTRVAVDARVAESLSGEAFMFYPPLPSRPLTMGDLFRAALRDRRHDLTTIVLMGVAGGVLGLVVPIVTGRIFGGAIPAADRSYLIELTLALILAAVAAATFQVTRSIAVLRLGGKMDGSVQAAVWDRLLALPAAFFRRFTVGDLANRSLGLDTIRDLLTGNILTSILASIFSVFSFALLFWYSRRLALLATALVLVLMAVTSGLVWLQLRHQRQLVYLEGKIASLLLGFLGGVAKLRVGGAEQRAFSLWAERFAEQRERAIQAQKASILLASFNAMYGVLTSLAIFAMVGFSTTETLSVGDFLAFYAAFGQFLAAALAMTGAFSSVLTIVPVWERLQPILREIPEVDPSKPDAGELAGDIEFSHVSFRYQEDGPLILDDVSFKARPGEFIALVGPSGAGKSTCLRLLLGFDKPVSGSIYFDGQDVSSLSLQSVRRQLGVVLQSGRPMTGDIFRNIVGSSNLGIEDAWEAARMAGMEEDIKAMPMGMHTVISEGAETFSGGQKQRLLIARAIVNRPRIILFDEATSALDNRTQEIVSRSLEGLKATRVVIAHRLSTIINADRIYVLQGGRVMEAGTYQELFRQGGLFAQLVARQVA